MQFDPPLTLEHYGVSNLNLVCNLAQGSAERAKGLVHVIADDTKAKVQIGITDQNPNLFKIDLVLTSQATQYDYRIAIDAFALVLVRPDFPKADRLKLLQINGASMLYGALRDYVLTVTGRGVLPPLYLPTLRFVDGSEGTEMKPAVTEPIGIARIQH